MPLVYTPTMPGRIASAPVEPTDLSGEDISLRAGGETTSGGDWAVVSGPQAARQSIEREAVASPGDLPRRPEWGWGGRDALMRSTTQTTRDRIAAAARQRLAANPRVDRVDKIDVRQHPTIQNATIIEIAGIVAGRPVAMTTTLKPRGV
jgi:phage baseplate assembly protein W